MNPSRTLLPAICCLLLLGADAAANGDNAPVALALHGGAGTIERAQLGEELEQSIRADLEAALDAGHTLLVEGGTALEAVVAVVTRLEDSPHFNAGKGAVFNAVGSNELDASIMEGHSLRAGAVAGLRSVKNPILLARGVMERSPHVMLVGDGAEEFAREIGIELVEPDYFRTQARWQQYLKFRDGQRSNQAARDRYFGTVGAVALDRHGHLAAATSTGGMTGKRYGRVGDAPIIGAGTYADAGCAVSSTGWGEFFIRLHVASDICARMRYGGQSLAQAADDVILRRVPQLGGNGGVIALDRQGRVHLPFNTPGMYRAAIDAEGKRSVAIYRDEGE